MDDLKKSRPPKTERAERESVGHVTPDDELIFAIAE